MLLLLSVYSFISFSDIEPNNCNLYNFLDDPMGTEQVFMSNQVVDAVGINTHLNYMNTVYNTQYEKLIKPKLIDLGIKHIRDHLGNKTVNGRYAELAHNHNIRLLVINDDNGQNLDRNLNEIKRLNNINPDKNVVELIEPANETDNGWNESWDSICVYLQKFCDTYHEDEKTSSIPLLGPSFANTRNSALQLAKQCSNTSLLMDFGNLHAYSGLYPESPLSGGWGISLHQAINNYSSISEEKPIIETENGYKTSFGIEGHPAVSQYVAAKYMPRLILTRLQQGVSRVYLYQLINDHNKEDFGILNDNGTPRLQYHSLKNFLSLMHDPGGDFIPVKLDYKLIGNLEYIQHMLFQKRNGTYMLILWQGVNGSNGGYNNDDYENLLVDEIVLSLELKKKARSIKVYKPSFNALPDGNGIMPIYTKSNIKTIQLNVPDHILVIEIKV